MPVTIRDVARELNLSHTTISRVLNDQKGISIPAVTRERIHATARQMGYSPNRSARALVTGRTHLVALQMHRLSSPYSWMVSHEMQSLIRANGYEVLVREYGSGDLTLQSTVDGILALDTEHMPDHSLNSSRPAVPYVVFGARTPQTHALDCVRIDLEVGARQATEHLIRQGRTCIVHVTSAPEIGDARSDGYRAIMTEAGLSPEFIVMPDDRRMSGLSVMAQCAAKGIHPDALFCRNDELASGCLRSLLDLGRSVPNDIAVIGCDGLEEGEYLQPRLTTIVPPIREMCLLAWRFLQKRMAEPDTDQQTVTLASELLLRQSA